MERKAYPRDVTEEEWAFVAPYLTLMTEEASQREHNLRTLQSTPECGERARYDGAKRKKGSKTHIVVDTLGHLLAL